jgi:peptide chain release factor 1
MRHGWQYTASAAVHLHPVPSERSQTYNKATALAILRARLHEQELERHHATRVDDRRRQIGSGQRGDKRRTIAVQRDSVIDHLTGRSWRFDDYVRGRW